MYLALKIAGIKDNSIINGTSFLVEELALQRKFDFPIFIVFGQIKFSSLTILDQHFGVCLFNKKNPRNSAGTMMAVLRHKTHAEQIDQGKGCRLAEESILLAIIIKCICLITILATITIMT